MRMKIPRFSIINDLMYSKNIECDLPNYLFFFFCKSCRFLCFPQGPLGRWNPDVSSNKIDLEDRNGTEIKIRKRCNAEIFYSRRLDPAPPLS